MTIEIPVLSDAKAENLLRAAWQHGDMSIEWTDAYLRDVLPHHDYDAAERALRSLADLLNNANAAEQDGLMAAADQYTDEAIGYAHDITRRERDLATLAAAPHLAVVR